MGRRGKIAILLVAMMMLVPMTSLAAKPIKLFIAGTSGAEDTQSMGHFEFAKRLNAVPECRQPGSLPYALIATVGEVLDRFEAWFPVIGIQVVAGSGCAIGARRQEGGAVGPR